MSPISIIQTGHHHHIMFYIIMVQSQTLDITCGVPQGPVLGPLLFLIYVNDIAICLTHSKLISFADDTTVFLSSKYKNMKSDLDDLTNWFKANRLALNVNKCNCMLFQPNGNQYTLGNTGYFEYRRRSNRT